MLTKVLQLMLFAVLVAACSSAPSEEEAGGTPERAVVMWFEAIDDGDAATASAVVNGESLALILGIENDLDHDTIAVYLDEGVSLDLQASYWDSFSSGFAEFSSRPVSTLTVGESEASTAEGVEFASVPVAAGGGAESVVIVRKAEDGSWEVDLVATLADGFVQLLSGDYSSLPDNETGDRIRQAYGDVVVPAMWGAMADGSFGDDFTRSALALIDQIDA